jgi:hypothetical protein
MMTSGSHDHNGENRNSSGAAGILTEEQKRVVGDGLSLRLLPTNIARIPSCGVTLTSGGYFDHFQQNSF